MQRTKRWGREQPERRPGQREETHEGQARSGARRGEGGAPEDAGPRPRRTEEQRPAGAASQTDGAGRKRKGWNRGRRAGVGDAGHLEGLGPWKPRLRGGSRRAAGARGRGSGLGAAASRGLGRGARRRPGEVAAAVRGAGVRGSGAACVFLLLLFLIKEEFISYLPPARGRGAAIGVNGAEEYKKISLRRIIKVTSWNINRRVTCKKCNITIFTRTAERGKAIKFNIKIFHSLDNLVNKHGIGTTFCWG